MNNFEILGIQDTNDISESTKKTLSELDSGFEILAKYNTMLGIFETYAEYLMNVQNKSIYETNRIVEEVINKMIEEENIGTVTLLEEIKEVIFSKFKESNYKNKLINNVGKRINNISERYMKNNLKQGFECFDIDPNTDAHYLKAKEVILYYTEEVLEQMSKYLPKDYLNKLSF
jgi:hypothetical protein